MPQVVVTIDGKTYRMACSEGEEAHLAAMAAEVDGRVSGLRSSFGEIGDQRLTVMAAIMTNDELAESRRRIADLEAEVQLARRERDEALQQAGNGAAALAMHLNDAAAAIDRISDKLVRRGPQRAAR